MFLVCFIYVSDSNYAHSVHPADGVRVAGAAAAVRHAGECDAAGGEARAAVDSAGDGEQPPEEVCRAESAAERVHVVPGDQGPADELGAAHGPAHAATAATAPAAAADDGW